MNYPIQSMGIVILAAGQSSRLGKPKQMLQWEGMTLLEKVVKVATELKPSSVMVVLGAYAEEIKSHLHIPAIEVVVNESWQDGMASSIRTGIDQMIKQNPQVDGILFLVCDQPHLKSDLLNNLVNLQKEKDMPVAASSYGGKLGTPALFHQSIFGKLMELKGDTGARKLLDEMMSEVAVLNFEKGIYDIDTPQDYEKLIEVK